MMHFWNKGLFIPGFTLTAKKKKKKKGGGGGGGSNLIADIETV